MTHEELEKLVLDIKDKLSFWRGAFVVCAASILAWLSIQSFHQIPATVDAGFEAIIGKEIEAKVKKINAAADNLDKYLVTLLDGRQIKLQVPKDAGFQESSRFVGFVPNPHENPRPNSQDGLVVCGNGPGEILTIVLPK